MLKYLIDLLIFNMAGTFDLFFGTFSNFTKSIDYMTDALSKNPLTTPRIGPFFGAQLFFENMARYSKAVIVANLEVECSRLVEAADGISDREESSVVSRYRNGLDAFSRPEFFARMNIDTRIDYLRGLRSYCLGVLNHSRLAA